MLKRGLDTDAVVAVTGLYQSWRQVGQVSALVDTTYGWWLLGKLSLVALLLATGYLTRRWVRGHYRQDAPEVSDAEYDALRRRNEALAAEVERSSLDTPVLITTQDRARLIRLKPHAALLREIERRLAGEPQAPKTPQATQTPTPINNPPSGPGLRGTVTFLMTDIGQRVVRDIRNHLFTHILDQSAGFFTRNSSGSLMSRITNDVNQIQQAVSETLGDLMRESLSLVGFVLLLFWLDWQLALVAVTGVPGTGLWAAGLDAAGHFTAKATLAGFPAWVFFTRPDKPCTGAAGSGTARLHHVKQPSGIVGPLDLVHDYANGPRLVPEMLYHDVPVVGHYSGSSALRANVLRQCMRGRFVAAILFREHRRALLLDGSLLARLRGRDVRLVTIIQPHGRHLC